MAKRILEPAKGSIVLHEYTMKDIYIVSGDFQINGRLSNFWGWRTILDDGTLGELETGYGGCFLESSNKYEIDIICKKIV